MRIFSVFMVQVVETSLVLYFDPVQTLMLELGLKLTESSCAQDCTKNTETGNVKKISRHVITQLKIMQYDCYFLNVHLSCLHQEDLVSIASHVKSSKLKF